MTDRIRVAVDGGQSQVRLWATGAASVAVEGLGRLEGDPAEGLVSRVAEALTEAGVAGRAIERMVLGLTTMPGTPVEAGRLAARLGERLGAADVRLAGDALTAHAGAFGGESGVVLTVGTGIACLGLDAGSGRARRVDGDGFLLGDAGGSFWIGSRGIEAVLRSRDGRGPTTALESAVVAVYGPHPDLAAVLHDRERAVSEIAAFAQHVQEAADHGDRIAARVIADAVDELQLTARAAAAVVSGGPVAVALSGRAVGDDTVLGHALRARFDEDPLLAVVPAKGDPLAGSRLLAESDSPGPYDQHMTQWRRA